MYTIKLDFSATKLAEVMGTSVIGITTYYKTSFH